MAVAKAVTKTAEPLLKVGAIVNLERSGRTLTGLEVLEIDEHFVKFRWDMHVSPQTEIGRAHV